MDGRWRSHSPEVRRQDPTLFHLLLQGLGRLLAGGVLALLHELLAQGLDRRLLSLDVSFRHRSHQRLDDVQLATARCIADRCPHAAISPARVRPRLQKDCDYLLVAPRAAAHEGRHPCDRLLDKLAHVQNQVCAGVHRGPLGECRIDVMYIAARGSLHQRHVGASLVVEAYHACRHALGRDVAACQGRQGHILAEVTACGSASGLELLEASLGALLRAAAHGAHRPPHAHKTAPSALGGGPEEDA
mmetsp:Transcript_62521/g.161032  ORF Transcript_62521/g.161032 Transcript_62521/m.161032 type:complete len:245 (+) Transcript_62521:194-928(+)